MNLRIVVTIVLVAVVGCWQSVCGWEFSATSRRVHRIFINGQVLSMDAGNRVFEALSVRDSRVEKLGSTAEIMASQTSGYRCYRLAWENPVTRFCRRPRSFSRLRS